MKLFAISDLHLSLGTDKPMDIFGHSWENYEERLEKNWRETISDDDTVIINGDISWATYLENTTEDFKFINNLPGRKIFLKGNHDYWWTTLNKQNAFYEENDFSTINVLQNNFYMVKDAAICGTRGWQLTKNNEHDRKVYERELQRLKLSLDAAAANKPREIITALHYPPDNKFKELLSNYRVSVCVYGHLHGNSYRYVRDTIEDGISYRLVSCDYLNFIPLEIKL